MDESDVTERLDVDLVVGDVRDARPFFGPSQELSFSIRRPSASVHTKSSLRFSSYQRVSDSTNARM